jgi:hypothetical protein
MPVNGDELVAAARVEFARTGISCPAEFFSAPIQYFVNSQLHYTANRAIAGRWPVEREVRYSANSKHTADVRIAVSADKHTDRPAAAIGEPPDPGVLEPTKELVAGLARDIELSAQHRHLLSLQQSSYKAHPLVHLG